MPDDSVLICIVEFSSLQLYAKAGIWILLMAVNSASVHDALIYFSLLIQFFSASRGIKFGVDFKN